MTIKYHINPATGKPGRCNPTKTGICRYGEAAAHYASEDNALKAYELSMESEMFSNTTDSDSQAQLVFPGMEAESLTTGTKIAGFTDLDGFEKGTLLEKDGRVFEITRRYRDNDDFELSEVTPNGHRADRLGVYPDWDAPVKGSRVIDNKMALQLLAQNNPDSLAAKAMRNNEELLTTKDLLTNSTTGEILDIDKVQPFDLYLEPKSGNLYQVQDIHYDGLGNKTAVSVSEIRAGDFTNPEFYLDRNPHAGNSMTRLDSYKKMDEDFTRRFREDYNANENSNPIPSSEELENHAKNLEATRDAKLEELDSILKDREATAGDKEEAILDAITAIDKVKKAKMRANPEDKETLFKARIAVGELAVQKFELNLKQMSLSERRQGYGKVYRESIQRNQAQVDDAKLKLSKIAV